MKDKLLLEISPRYSLFVGLPEQTKDVQCKVYKIINTITDVLEAETSVYGKAVAYIMSLDEMANEADASLSTKQGLEKGVYVN